MDKKFEKIYNVSDYEVLTDTGWKDILMVGKTMPYDIWELELEDDKQLSCADDHILFSDNKKCMAKDLEIGQVLDTQHGPSKIIKCENTGIKENMYDIQVDGKKYYSNGILSHNTTAVSVYALWYSIFNPDKTIGIVSNKESSAKMILSRFKRMYKGLPDWLKPGVVEFSKMFVVYDNNTRIIISATSEDAFRGETINLLIADEFAFALKNQADAFWASNYPTVSASKTSKIIVISCVTDDTYIFTNEGPKQFKNFVDYNKNDGYTIKDYSIMGKNKLNHGNLIVNNTVTDTKIITTTSTSLEGSLKHKLWSCKNGNCDWHKLSELNIGDYVSIKYGMNIWGDNNTVNFKSKERRFKKGVTLEVKEITEDWAYLFGLYIAEGYADKYRLNIACGDDISWIFRKLGLKYTEYKDGIHYVVSSLSLIDFFKYVGFDINRKSPRKIIPQRLLEMSPNNISSLLRGIFDGDGYARKKKGGIGIGLSSKKLIMQIKMLLLNFGILTDYYEVESKPTKIVKVYSMQYRITCSRNHARKFYEKIGFNLKRKQDCMKSLPPFKEAKIDIVPFSKDILKKNGLINILGKKLGKSLYSRGPNGHLSRLVSLRIKNLLINMDIPPEVNEFYENNVSENIKWEKIKEIKDSKNKVYDFSLPDKENDPWCHSVIYNGYIGHQTPNGMFNLFHRLYSDAERGENTFFPTKFDWKAVPGRTEEWADEQRKNLGPHKFAQEFQVAFIGSTNTVISPTCLKVIINQWKEPEQIDMEEKLFVYESPVKNCIYILGVDPAKGTGENWSVIQVLKVESTNPIKMKQVAVFSDNFTDVYTFSDIINRLSYYYNNAYIMVESNGEGSAVVNRLWWELENENLINTGVKEKDLGIRATKSRKQKAILLMKKLIEDYSLELVDKETIEQLTSFVEEKEKFFGKDKPDDRVSALYWACYILEMDILDETYKFKANKEDDSWGILSDVNTDTDDWSWLRSSNFID